MFPQPVTVTSYNMHKGMSALNREVQIERMAAALSGLDSDIFFLQEVQGMHQKRSSNLPDFPTKPHYDILGDRLSLYRSYGKNAVYPHKHHGNAILSRLPIDTRHNLNISVNRLEQRGVLHCEVHPEGWPLPLVCLCVHLNLLEPDRAKQYQAISRYIAEQIDPFSPMIIAGDFNDWRHKSEESLGCIPNLKEAFIEQHGRLPKTFPSRLPMLSLDRIYTRHLNITGAQLHNGKHWQKLSDHLPLSVSVTPRYAES